MNETIIAVISVEMDEKQKPIRPNANSRHLARNALKAGAIEFHYDTVHVCVCMP